MRAFVRRTLGPVVVAMTTGSLSLIPLGGPALAGSSPARAQSPSATGALRAACPVPRPGWARCFVLYRTLTRGTGAAASARPVGLTPRDIEAAYRLPVRCRAPANAAAGTWRPRWTWTWSRWPVRAAASC